MKKTFFLGLALFLLLGLTACGNTSTSGDDASKKTIVGNWAYIDKSVDWRLGFTEDGDFYDSRAEFMVASDNIQYQSSNYGSWRIRADGRLWLTAELLTWGEQEWAYSYELDGDTLRIGNKTFIRIGGET